jgi:hypothetical protein
MALLKHPDLIRAYLGGADLATERHSSAGVTDEPR